MKKKKQTSEEKILDGWVIKPSKPKNEWENIDILSEENIDIFIRECKKINSEIEIFVNGK